MLPKMASAAAQGLTPLGAQVFTALYNTDDNSLVAAPTGSGKTACAEFALLRMIQKAAGDKGVARAVYIAPLPALAKERLADWDRQGLAAPASCWTDAWGQ